jgi:hypothetical protein
MATNRDEASSLASQLAYSRDEVLEQLAKDDQDEWEYEYSNTETEVSAVAPSYILRQSPY